MPTLIVRPGKADERVVPLSPGIHTIGRTAENEIHVLDESISRRHARLIVARESVVFEDLGSRNGSFVDGTRIERHTLGPAHFLKCGDVVFAFTAGGALGPGATLVIEANEAPTLEELVARPAPADAADKAERRLRILLEVSEILSSPGELEGMLDRIVALSFRILPIDRATLLLVGSGGLEPRIARKRGGPIAPGERPFSARIVGLALERKAAVLVEDVPDDARLSGHSVARQSILAAMCAPLSSRDGRVLGAIYLDNVSRPRPFDGDDLALLAAFARQAAIAIDNARLSARLAQEAVDRSHLLRFFPPAAIETILRQGLALVETEATIVFCDISGFTRFSSGRAPREVVAMLNAYFPAMAEIVFAHEGTLEKYIGDALLAVWGAPLSRPDDARRAVRAAIAMQRAAMALGPTFEGAGLAVHIGLASGPVAAGNVGTGHYLQYATIGDATNRAARICALAAPEEIVIDDETRRRLGDDWPLEPLAPVVVKGKAEPLSVHRLEWRSVSEL